MTVSAPAYVHFFFEAFAYALAGRLYLRPRAPIAEGIRLAVLVGAALGAACGSKLLYWLEWPEHTLRHLADPAWLLGGKSIVGGLLGGWGGVEIAKRRLRERRSTGDAFVWPLIAGISVGRIGCFLSGLADHTLGAITTLPWGVDFGDGELRHPVQLYEIVALLAMVWPLARWQAPPGARFRGFLIAYFCLRFGLSALKPDPRWIFGLTAIQAACILGAIVAAYSLLRLLRRSGSALGPLEVDDVDQHDRSEGKHLQTSVSDVA